METTTLAKQMELANNSIFGNWIQSGLEKCEELKAAMEKLGLDENAEIYKVEYADYFGSLWDRALIEVCKEKYPENIVVWPTMYNGEIAFVFGNDDFMWEHGTDIAFSEVDEKMDQLQNSILEETIEYFIEDEREHITDIDKAREYLETYFLEACNMYPNQIDYCDSNVIEALKGQNLYK